MDEVARGSSQRGDIVLLRRPNDDLELRVNGVFVMDTEETSSERMLARAALEATREAVPKPAPGSLRVLIGGLGLGFTLREFLADPLVHDVVVAEIEGDLVDWHRAGLITQGQSLLEDSRVEVVVNDVRDVVSAQPADSFDIIVLDVDNGPGFLVYEENAELYQRGFLTTCAAAARPAGRVAIWSADRSAPLLTAMQDVFAAVEEWPIPVILGGRATTYHLYLGQRELATKEP